MGLQSVCRICRREGMKLYLKGTRCETEKCAFERRAYAPGQHGQKRKKDTEYGLQLREKQKVKRIYGVLEKQFPRYFLITSLKKRITGETLHTFLEQSSPLWGIFSEEESCKSVMCRFQSFWIMKKKL